MHENVQFHVFYMTVKIEMSMNMDMDTAQARALTRIQMGTWIWPPGMNLETGMEADMELGLKMNIKKDWNCMNGHLRKEAE